MRRRDFITHYGLLPRDIFISVEQRLVGSTPMPTRRCRPVSEEATKGAKMTTKDPIHFYALRDAFEAASEEARAEFLEWLDRDRVPSPRTTTDDPVPWNDDEPSDPNVVKAWDAHEEEANRLGAEFGNFGWSSGDYGDWFVITSKTSRGRFSTSSHAKTGEVKHFWHDVE
jgi:hypothetical protein